MKCDKKMSIILIIVLSNYKFWMLMQAILALKRFASEAANVMMTMTMNGYQPVFINILVQLIHRLLFIVSEIEEKCENCVEKISSSFLFDRYFEGSAGIGRTGMLILMDTSISLLNVNEPVYPLDIVKNMRDQRPCMVQNVVSFP